MKKQSRWQAPLLLSPAVGTLVVLFLLPSLILFVYSFAQRDTYGGVRTIVDLGDYVRSFQWLSNYSRAIKPIYLEIYFRSFWIAGITTILCLLLAYPIAYFISLKVRASWKNTLLVLVVIPFWTSFLVRTYAWITILRTEGLLNRALLATGIIDAPIETLLYSEFAVLLGLVYGELPFMILPLYASLEKLDRTILEAARDLGASRWTAFFRVTIPLTTPGIVAGIIFVFIPSVGAFITPDLLGGAKTMLVGNLIQNQFMLVRDEPFGSAVSFGLTAFVLLMLLMYARYSTRKEKAIYV